MEQAQQTFGTDGRTQLNKLLQDASALLAGGQLEDADQVAFMRAINDIYYDARQKARPTAAKAIPHRRLPDPFLSRASHERCRRPLIFTQAPVKGGLTMPTKYELARTEALEQRRQMRRRELWLWRRRMLTWMLLGVATLAALISIIIGIAVPVEELEAAGNPVSGMPAASAAEPDTAATTDAVDGPEAPTGPESTDPLRAAVKAPPGDLSLVNASHLWNFPETSTLVSIYAQKLDSYNVRDTTLLLEGRVIEPLNWMLADFYTETGCENLLLCAAYRTLEEQQYLWDHGMDTQGEEHTTSYIAQPGASEHHTGLALDFAIYDVYHGITYDFDGSGDSAWILEHCWEYGFIQRYPEGKSTVTGHLHRTVALPLCGTASCLSDPPEQFLSGGIRSVAPAVSLCRTAPDSRTWWPAV